MFGRYGRALRAGKSLGTTGANDLSNVTTNEEQSQRSPEPKSQRTREVEERGWRMN